MHSTPVTYRRIAAIALPVIAANILLPLQGLVDTAIMGHFPDPSYLSALGLSAAAFALLYASLNFLQYATSGLSAQALGNGDHGKIQRILWRALIIAVLLAGIIIAFQVPIVRLAQWYFDANPHTGELIAQYMHTRIWGAAFELGIYCTIGWFAGQSQTVYLLIQQAVLTSANIALSLLLVYGFDLGIHGVALGTVFANTLAFCVGIIMVVRHQRQNQYHFLRPNWARIFRWSEIRAVLGLNRDLFIRTTMLVLCMSWFQRMGNQLGEAILAAHVILLWLLTIASYALDGIAVAAESLTGQSIGAGDRQQLRNVIRRTTIASIAAASLLTVLYALVFPHYLQLMTNIREVARIAVEYRWWAILLPLAGVGGYLIDGYYFGATAAAPLRNAMLIIATITLPLTWLLTRQFGNDGLWLAIYTFLLLRPIILAPRLKHHLYQ